MRTEYVLSTKVLTAIKQNGKKYCGKKTRVIDLLDKFMRRIIVRISAQNSHTDNMCPAIKHQTHIRNVCSSNITRMADIFFASSHSVR